MKKLVFSTFLNLSMILCICISCVNATDKGHAIVTTTQVETLKDLENTIWSGDRWTNMGGGGAWTLVAIKILSADAKTVKGLYCLKPQYSPPNCTRFIAGTVPGDPKRFIWNSRAGNTIDLFFRDGRIVGTRSMNATGLSPHSMVYAISLQRVEGEPFPFEELQFPPFPADAMSPIDNTNLPPSLRGLANKTWEGAWYNSKTKAQTASLRIRLAEYDEKQKLVKLYYAWIYGHPYPSGIREMHGTFEEGKNLTVQDIHRNAIKITFQLDQDPENDHIHAIRDLPEPLGYVADFMPVP